MNNHRLIKITFCAVLMYSIASCDSAHQKGYGSNDSYSQPAAEKASVNSEKAPPVAPVINGYISSSATEETSDTSRKFIKTADIKFRVKNVYSSTSTIEDIIKKMDGFVTSTTLNSDVNTYKNTVTSVSDDSMLETTHYTVSNTMVLRVPSRKLDTTLRAIARQIDFLDYRNIKAEDVQFQILEDQLSSIRAWKHALRLEKDINTTSDKKLKDATSAEESLANQEEQQDNDRIAKLTMMDKIQFSTVNLVIYQRETIKRELIPNENNIKAYEPGFGYRIISALKSGWTILLSIAVFLVNIWFLYVIAIVCYLIYRLMNKKRKKS